MCAPHKRKNVYIKFVVPNDSSSVLLWLQLHLMTNLLDIWISWKLSRFYLVNHFKWWEQTNLIGSCITSFRETIPVVSGHPNRIAHIHEDFFVIPRMMRYHHLSIVGILSTIIVDIVQRFESVWGIRVHGLHDFVRYTAHLRTECADQVVGEG